PRCRSSVARSPRIPPAAPASRQGSVRSGALDVIEMGQAKLVRGAMVDLIGPLHQVATVAALAGAIGQEFLISMGGFIARLSMYRAAANNERRSQFPRHRSPSATIPHG